MQREKLIPTVCIKALSREATSPKKAHNMYRQFSRSDAFMEQKDRVYDALLDDEMCFFRLENQGKDLVDTARALDARDNKQQSESRWRDCVGRYGWEEILKLPLVKLFPVEVWTDLLRVYSDVRFGSGTVRQEDFAPGVHARGEELGPDGLRKELQLYLDQMIQKEWKYDERLRRTPRERTKSPAALGHQYSSLQPEVYERKMEVVKAYIVESIVARRQFHQDNSGRALQRFAPFVAAVLHNLEAAVCNEALAKQAQEAQAQQNKYAKVSFSFGFGRF